MSRPKQRVIAWTAAILTAFGTFIALSAPASADSLQCLRFLQNTRGYVLTNAMVNGCNFAFADGTVRGVVTCQLSFMAPAGVSALDSSIACQLGAFGNRV